MNALVSRAVFLDRDGVLNKAIVKNGKPFPPSSMADFEIFPNLEGLLKEIKALNFLLIVVTNQPDVVRGIISKKVVDQFNFFLQQALPIDEIRVCYHDESDNCRCRKPKAGSLLSAAVDHNLDLSSSYMVGDRWRDIDAGKKAGCKTIFVDYKYSEKISAIPDYTVRSSFRALQLILNIEKSYEKN